MTRSKVAMRYGSKLAVVLLCVATLSGVVSEKPVGAADSFITVASHNIQYYGWGGLAYVADHDRPLMMMGQEVCTQAIWSLIVNIAPFGYGHHPFPQVGRAANCNNSAQNTVAFVQAPTSLVNHNYHPGSNTHGWACIRGWFGRYFRSCSTHMNPGQYSLGYLQSENMRLNVVPPDAVPTIIGGDFNLRPRGYSGYNTYPWRGSWDEGDDLCFNRNIDRRTLKFGVHYLGCPAYGYERGVKIDYTWASRLWFRDAFGQADIRCGVTSDHCLYFAGYLSSNW